MEIKKVNRLNGEVIVPGDKSISHRSIIFASLAEGTSRIKGLLNSADVISTREAFAAMGVGYEQTENEILVHGVGMHGLKKPSAPLDCGNSGTTMRLMMGLLAGQNFDTELVGDISLSGRPMKRVAMPLEKMGAKIELREQNFAPVKISGKQLKGLHYELPVASAQVKSALILAGLYADSETVLTGQIQSRDHTERMLPHFGCPIETHSDRIVLKPAKQLNSAQVQVPGDISSAAFWIVAAAITPNSRVILKNVCLNPSRTGILDVAERMGICLKIEVLQQYPEPIGNITVESSQFKGTKIGAEEMSRLVDEIPIIAILASQAHGETLITGAEELRVKESDRLMAVEKGLKSMGVEFEVFADGLKIVGPQKLKGAQIATHHDHRIAMAFSIAGLVAEGTTIIEDAEVVGVSYPHFYQTLAELSC